jgi:hypothetical protein
MRTALQPLRRNFAGIEVFEIMESLSEHSRLCKPALLRQFIKGEPQWALCNAIFEQE